jgi:hypothetical protein
MVLEANPIEVDAIPELQYVAHKRMGLQVCLPTTRARPFEGCLPVLHGDAPPLPRELGNTLG